MHHLIASLCLVVFAVAMTYADEADHRQYGPWRSAYIGGGGYIQNIVPTRDPDRFYSYVDVGGAYRSDDGGRTWRQLLTGDLPARQGIFSVRGLSVDPRDSEQLVIATGTQWAPIVGILRSEDAGQTWELVQEAVFFGNGPLRTAGRVLVRQPDNPDVIIAGSAGAVYRSEDNGRTWQRTGPAGLLINLVHFDQADPQRVWLGATAGTRWVGGEEQETFEGGFYQSDDAGQTWSHVSDEAPTTMAQHPDDPGRLYALFDVNRLRTSDDDGRTWTDAMDSLPLDGTGSGSIDANISRALAAGPDRLLLATGNGDLYQLIDEADGWEPVERENITADDWWYGNYGQRDGWVHFGKALTSIVVNPHDHDQWFFSDWYAIWRSDDRGRNWELSVDGIEVTVMHTLLQMPDDPDWVLLGMADNGAMWSADGGNTWHMADSGSPNNVKDMDLSPANPERVYATGPATHGWHANAVYVSDDRGRTWTAAGTEGLPTMEDHRSNSLSVHPDDPEQVILGVSGEVGEDAGGVYRSDDGGATWTWIGQGLPEDEGYFRTSIWAGGRELAISGDGSMVAFSRDQGLLHRYDEASDQWQGVDVSWRGGPFSLSADPLTPGRFYLGVSDDGFYRSDDGGESWQRHFEGNVFHVRADAVQQDRVAIGTEEGVYVSSDAGEQFRHLGHSLPYKERPFATFAGERVVVGTTGTGVFWRMLEETDDESE